MINQRIFTTIELADAENTFYDEYVIRIPDELVGELGWRNGDEVEIEIIPGHMIVHKINK